MDRGRVSQFSSSCSASTVTDAETVAAAAAASDGVNGGGGAWIRVSVREMRYSLERLLQLLLGRSRFS